MITDSISDFIVRLKNASDAGKTTTSVKRSKLVENIAHTLKKAGYVSSVDKSDKDAFALEIGLVYFGKEPRIHGVERISKPSRRIYQKYSDIRTFRSGFGNVFLSTPKGIMVDVDARKNKVGGEVLFKIW
jgi:small subunit ribosomal protein S8